MEKMVIIIEDTIDSKKAIDKVENDFICFTSYEMLEKGYVELSIICRAEDAGSIESRLAKYV